MARCEALLARTASADQLVSVSSTQSHAHFRLPAVRFLFQHLFADEKPRSPQLPPVAGIALLAQLAARTRRAYVEAGVETAERLRLGSSVAIFYRYHGFWRSQQPISKRPAFPLSTAEMAKHVAACGSFACLTSSQNFLPLSSCVRSSQLQADDGSVIPQRP